MRFFCFAHLRWCHNGWASNIFSGGCRRSRYSQHPPRLKYWMPIHYDTIEDGQNKKSHLLLSFLVRIVLLLHFTGEIYLSKLLLHRFIDFIWIITPLMKINVSIQETKIIAWRVKYATTRVIAERAIHHGPVMDGRSFGQNQWNFLLTC